MAKIEDSKIHKDMFIQQGRTGTEHFCSLLHSVSTRQHHTGCEGSSFTPFHRCTTLLQNDLLVVHNNAKVLSILATAGSAKKHQG